jgi:hypothetical protein
MATREEIQDLLNTQFGGFSFFLNNENQSLMVGLTNDRPPQVVEASDPRAVEIKHVLDVIVEQGIVAPSLIEGVVEKTRWFQETDGRMRDYDAATAGMTDLERIEFLEPVTSTVQDTAQFLGISLTDDRARSFAETIARLGEEENPDYVRTLLATESQFNPLIDQGGGFGEMQDALLALSRQYYAPIGMSQAGEFAYNIYTGNQTTSDVTQMFKDRAIAEYPMLQKAIESGITPDQYFAPYQYEVEQLLGRPNINLYEEFPEILQHTDAQGNIRPMTLHEVRRFVRSQPEWQQSVMGQDSARKLAFVIGQTFGEVA